MRLAALLALALGLAGCPAKPDAPAASSSKEIDAELAKLCQAYSEHPVVEEPAPNIFVARGFDLANTILIKTSAGNVIVDVAMSPVRAALGRKALLEKAPGKILAIIYTHSHLDHVGGASAWEEPGTEIWASAPFIDTFLKQYGLFQPIEALRGSRQYGRHVPGGRLGCTSIGPLPDIDAATASGARLPTNTFSGTKSLTFGDTELVLEEAHGESADEILVWLPKTKTVLAADNIYKAFPNLYTIRGTTPRPVNEWIASLDRMRALLPEVLIPSHTEPLKGRAAIQDTLTAYRDAIQWVLDATVRGANAGLSADRLAETVKLPPHLAAHPYLQETYGRVDWSVRGLYSDHLGWFGGEAERLIQLAPREIARRELELMGGAGRVLELAELAQRNGVPTWSLHLLGRLRQARAPDDTPDARWTRAYVAALDAEAGRQLNTNARAYLAETAYEADQDKAAKAPDGKPDDEMIRQLPLAVFFRRTVTLLHPDQAEDLIEAVRWNFTDTKQVWWITMRHGIAEEHEGAALPGTPAPVATVKVDAVTWKKLALKRLSIAAALASGKLTVDGSLVAFGFFMARFR